ncbi:hypothetical protein OPT61_g9878 [Boeremia exigua]|uniref:Uncharacterized protein n=1 Tax=Boeremia exigua TaxID=749465 RepID=A0ACC2HTT6_9PLEO|nr:hypothetical protein OPT61_g9878 [Boeremia exigua]
MGRCWSLQRARQLIKRAGAEPVLHGGARLDGGSKACGVEAASRTVNSEQMAALSTTRGPAPRRGGVVGGLWLVTSATPRTATALAGGASSNTQPATACINTIAERRPVRIPTPIAPADELHFPS